jgi:ribonuclease HI
MELSAAIFALRALSRSTDADIFTDSRYLQDGITKWVHTWRHRNWHTYNNKPVINQDLWKELIAAVAQHHVHWKWVRGHSVDRYNNFVDQLARMTIAHRRGVDVKLSMGELKEVIDGRQIPWQF